MRKTPHKTMYILPNAFTVGSIVCGFFAIILALRGDNGPVDILRASLLIGLSMILDGMDGRVARLTNTQSAFGVQLDSLADVIAFGVAPAVVIYEWALSGLGIAGFFAASTFIVCGAARLARFNVQAAEDDGASTHFTGIPIPCAAGVLASFMLMNISAGRSSAGLEWLSVLLVLVMSGLMVSTVKYPTFKKASGKKGAPWKPLAVVGLVTAASVLWDFYLAIHVGLMLYIASGLAKSAIGVIRKRAARFSQLP
jgi:CDP-diacylglycerol---serine O-phosphatidyltransferase